MSTNANINVKTADGKYKAIYLHWDGDMALGILQKHYNSQEQAEALVALGDLSSLRSRLAPEAGEQHSFSNAVEDVCIFYGRDRGETGCGYATSHKPVKDFNYCYVFEDGEWKNGDNHG